MAVFRVYVEKKAAYTVEANGILHDIISSLGIKELTGLRLLNRYDVEGIDKAVFSAAVPTVFSEPQVDVVSYELPKLQADEHIFAVEYLPGQFDQRADSAAQCISLMTQKDRPAVRTARVFLLSGKLSKEHLSSVKSYIINPVEAREASLEPVATLNMQYSIPTTVELLNGFIGLSPEQLDKAIQEFGLAMDHDDILFCQDYFKNSEKRDPTITEIKMIDTYWSDHCRHTTFLTQIDNVSVAPDYIQKSYEKYLACRKEISRKKNKPVTLMDMATMGARYLKAKGLVPDLDESEEINACSVKIKADVNGTPEDYLLMFKNETHNHPTEIEPFGGAATCLGGAIRDPLSGRSYVYQAMRVTGASDPLVPLSQTLKGKLSQKKIVTTAANGYSSYGNQIGLATGHVQEIYHPGYVAKRMEIGAVIAAAPEKNVVRVAPVPGDIVILLGGRTGRDGCGGATGSSKSHTLESLESCGAEVQKGNAPEERKLQRLFRAPEVTRMIKRCNDFGAGGVSVAIGELADGLCIDLNAVPKKYEGLSGTELAISESQERMAVVVDKENTDRFIALAAKENLEATVVASVTESPRLVMSWNGNTIVNLSREFLNSNGAEKHTDIEVAAVACSPAAQEKENGEETDLKTAFEKLVSDLNVCSQKGLVERFDSTIGAGTVLMPYGGKYQLTPTQAMAAKIPVLNGETTTCSCMAWGYNPFIAEKSPYHAAMLAVVESVAKLVACGASYKKCWLTFQEYFERTQNDPKRWGKPFAALLGALEAQLNLNIASIGGKDSMSGTFEHIDVPPTLVSFAVSVADTGSILSPEFKKAGNKIAVIFPDFDENGLPCFDSVKKVFDTVEKLVKEKKAASAYAVSYGGVAEALFKMALGNRLGFRLNSKENLFEPIYGGLVLELAADASADGLRIVGEVSDHYQAEVAGEKLSLEGLERLWKEKLEPVFPTSVSLPKDKPAVFTHEAKQWHSPVAKTARPKVIIPVFPGTNCEYDTQRAFLQAGADAEIYVIRNLTASAIEQSVLDMEKLIKNAQIIMLPGGFSGGDEPDGSGKFITAFFRNPRIKDAVTELLQKRDGLMLGICNGFQALIKLGLVPYGEIRKMDESCPTLTFNTIGRHQSMLVTTRIASNKSPWLRNCRVGELHSVAVSHGEGRFIAPAAFIEQLAANGQIATQYVDLSGTPTYDIAFNPNTSMEAVEGITSPDGRIFGKMAHSERKGESLYKNVPGSHDQMIFASGVEYFK